MVRAAIVAALVLSACSSQAPSPSPLPATSEPASAQATATPPPSGTATQAPPQVQEYAVSSGSGLHDVAPAADGGVWYTGQRNGTLGHLDPATGRVREIKLGGGSAPHGVIVDRDGVAWVTDGGLNAIVSVDPRASDRVTVHPMPAGTPRLDLNTAAFDRDGTLWFTGQNGWFGRLGRDGRIVVSEAPRGRGPYGITATPNGDVYYASLAGSFLGRVVKETGGTTVLEPPTKGQGARRAWTDSTGAVWVSEYNAGQVARYDPAANAWKEWKLPGAGALCYAVFVDDRDVVWLTDFGQHAIWRFDPASEQFTKLPYPANGNVRQLHGRPGEVWGALSGLDRLIAIRTR